MYILMVILHVLICLILIGVVLLQAGKGADAGITFGGSSQTLFGSRGAATFLSKLTIGTAVLYFVTSLGLTLLKQDRSVFRFTDDDRPPSRSIPVDSKGTTSDTTNSLPLPATKTPPPTAGNIGTPPLADTKPVPQAPVVPQASSTAP